MSRTLALRNETTRGDDSGVSVVELIVAMGIFTMVLVVSLAATVSMSNQAVSAQVVGDTASQLRKTFQSMDKELRYADAINAPGTSGGNIYVEYQVPATAIHGEELCVQWRYVTASNELQRRTWTPGTDADLTGWSTFVTDLQNDLTKADEQPFALHRAGPTGSKVFLRQGLDVYLDAGLSNNKVDAGSQLDVYMVARNSSAESVSNDPSGTQVCLVGGAQRP
ncbi:PulJ/GspJ family protein [Demequina aurantiaca]|uniref:PulJ/GspJ family protein n=1 Tax=Demequina aurantiaca TaxID=676200 RepID=UPI00128B165D|nr:hypothetical protein [Demequina aurantiaca]